MKTYQDYEQIKEYPERIKLFIEAAINEHKGSELYDMALQAEEYAHRRNITILKYQKYLYTISGEAVPDNYSANHKTCSNFFRPMINQLNQYLLGNGITLQNPDNKERLGDTIDNVLQEIGRNALVHGMSFGFWNFDHIECFKFTEFVPLWDEENGSLKGGIRYWQVASDKPLRVTLYDLDGSQNFIKKDGLLQEMDEKKPFVISITKTEADNEISYKGYNYPDFPIVPCWGNELHQSEFVGMREEIDAYDLIKSGFANDLDDVSQIYWILENAGAMDDTDISKFIERLRTLHAANVDGDLNATATAHTIEIPFQSRTAYLDRLEHDMYRDFGALDVTQISAGSKTATEIRAAYLPLDIKADRYEYCVTDFLKNIFKLAGIDDEPSYKRNRIVNETENTQMILSAAQYLDQESILKHLDWLTPEEQEEILDRAKENDYKRLLGGDEDLNAEENASEEPEGNDNMEESPEE